MAYATLLDIHDEGGATVAEIKDARHTEQVYRRYVIVPSSRPLPAHLPEGTLLRTPLKRIICAASVHAALIDELEKADHIAGICDTAFVMSPSLRRALREGLIADGGISYRPDAEHLLMMKPDAFLVSPVEGMGYDAISQTGIPIVECADYMEDTALGRAEWVKFFGLLLDCPTRSDSLFSIVCKEYTSLSALASSSTERPRLIVDTKSGTGWLMPGGKSYLAGIYKDAGATYVFGNRKERGSVNLSTEEVIRHGNADLWLIKYGADIPLTYERLAADYSPYRRISAWKDRRIFACNTLRIPYYEEIPFHPERLLKDFIHIFHPELLPDYLPRYYFPLE